MLNLTDISEETLAEADTLVLGDLSDHEIVVEFFTKVVKKPVRSKEIVTLSRFARRDIQNRLDERQYSDGDEQAQLSKGLYDGPGEQAEAGGRRGIQ